MFMFPLKNLARKGLKLSHWLYVGKCIIAIVYSSSSPPGVIARSPSLLPYLRQQLTAEAVDDYLSHLFDDRSGPLEDRVIRYGKNRQKKEQISLVHVHKQDDFAITLLFDCT